MNGETTPSDILEAITAFSGHMDEQFGEVKAEIGEIKQEIGGIKQEIGGIKERLIKVEATMVTKDYLDEKLGDLRGDLTILMRKEDGKVRALIGILRERNVLTEEDAKRVLSMEPFPQLSL